MTTRRSRESILVGILKACTVDKLTITRLMAALNLQHKKLKSYLDTLAAANLIEYEKRKRTIVISTTDRGEEAVKVYRNAIALLSGNYLTRPTNARLNEQQRSQSIPA